VAPTTALAGLMPPGGAPAAVELMRSAFGRLAEAVMLDRVYEFDEVLCRRDLRRPSYRHDTSIRARARPESTTFRHIRGGFVQNLVKFVHGDEHGAAG
jgi:hypothetical protein